MGKRKYSEIPGDIVKKVQEVDTLDWKFWDIGDTYHYAGKDQCDYLYSTKIKDVRVAVGKRVKHLRRDEYYLNLNDKSSSVTYSGDVVKDIFENLDTNYKVSATSDDVKAEKSIIDKLKGD